MSPITIGWITLPFFLGFSIYLLPRLARHLALGMALLSGGYGFYCLLDPATVTLQLLGNFGVTLMIDSLSGFFILTNAVVTAAVILYCWPTDKSAFFFTQVVILHGSVNSAFICADFISLYVALEVISIATFLLIAYSRADRAIWVGLRYLFISNTAMLFYLIGAVLVYQSNHSFAFAGLGRAPTEAIALIVLGLLTKGGIFVSGLWLPLTHAEAETPVSALLSGVVIKAGVFPLVRCALLVEDLAPVVTVFGAGAALLGVGYALVETDTKRLLASSTLSQMGFLLVAPAAAGTYALTHGLAKAALFLIAGNLPSRSFQSLRQNPMGRSLWIAMAIAALSIAGMPLFAGFGAKALTLKGLVGWRAIALNGAAVGTAILMSKFLFLPSSSWPDKGDSLPSPRARPAELWTALGLLLSGLVVANGTSLDSYTGANLVKALGTLGLGGLIYYFTLQTVTLRIPRGAETLEHLIGAMSLMLAALFWMVLT
ncbi:MAG: cation:proton antiporter [Kaiparowitsia implicata GSE-PSE-MK54-09C]|jgi:multicomponent Na+:H+ antiporter subunit D|nr:cation:proton antiporter [Kaiparowitsia implicata GSE-PSE-MK54-09C]